MSTNKDDGGPAFPRAGYGTYTGSLTNKTAENAPQPGMTLRDYFAAQALAGWLATYGAEAGHPAVDPRYPARIAEYSYTMADAMLAARRK